jgi:uncharacterized protein (DUF2062 family)
VRPLLEHLRDRLQSVVGVKEPPARLAAAWAVGIGIGMSPFLGLHTAIALLLAFAFRLNKVDVFIGTLIVNPWTLSAYFPAAVFLGKRLTGVHIPSVELPTPQTVFHLALWRGNATWIRSVLIAWGVGATVCALLSGVITYFVLDQAIERHRRRRLAHDQSSSGAE